MSRKSLCVAMLVVVLSLGMALPAFAQGDDLLCNGLDEADCALLMKAQAASEDLQVFSMPYWHINFNFETEDEAVAFDSFGSGAIALTEDMSDPVTVHLDIEDAMIDTSTETESGSAEFLLLDEMFYIRLDDVWYGGPMDMMDMETGDMGDMEDMEDMFGDMFEGMDIDDPFSMIEFADTVLTTRLADDELHGQDMAVFETEIGIPELVAALLTSPLTGAFLGEGGFEADGIEPEDVEMLSLMIAPMLGETSLTMQQWVGLDDNMLHKVNVDMVLDLNLRLLAPEIGELAGEMSLSVEMDDFGVMPELTAPEEYEPLPEAEFEGFVL